MSQSGLVLSILLLHRSCCKGRSVSHRPNPMSDDDEHPSLPLSDLPLLMSVTPSYAHFSTNVARHDKSKGITMVLVAPSFLNLPPKGLWFSQASLSHVTKTDLSSSVLSLMSQGDIPVTRMCCRLATPTVVVVKVCHPRVKVHHTRAMSLKIKTLSNTSCLFRTTLLDESYHANVLNKDSLDLMSVGDRNNHACNWACTLLASVSIHNIKDNAVAGQRLIRSSITRFCSSIADDCAFEKERYC
jgi:hypothetical protein